jgi:hypothetical protein
VQVAIAVQQLPAQPVEIVPLYGHHHARYWCTCPGCRPEQQLHV